MSNSTRQIIRKNYNPPSSEKVEEKKAEPVEEKKPPEPVPQPERPEPKMELAIAPELAPATVLSPATATAEVEEIAKEPEHINIPDIPEYTEGELEKQAEHLKPKEEQVEEKPKIKTVHVNRPPLVPPFWNR